MFYDLAGQQRTLWGGGLWTNPHLLVWIKKMWDTIQKLSNSAPWWHSCGMACTCSFTSLHNTVAPDPHWGSLIRGQTGNMFSLSYQRHLTLVAKWLTAGWTNRADREDIEFKQCVSARNTSRPNSCDWLKQKGSANCGVSICQLSYTRFAQSETMWRC